MDILSFVQQLFAKLPPSEIKFFNTQQDASAFAADCKLIGVWSIQFETSSPITGENKAIMLWAVEYENEA